MCTVGGEDEGYVFGTTILRVTWGPLLLGICSCTEDGGALDMAKPLHLIEHRRPINRILA